MPAKEAHKNSETHERRRTKPYASNATGRILEILWRHTYYGHGLTVAQILGALQRELGDDAPSRRTVLNQLNALHETGFLGRAIGQIDEQDLDGIGCADPRPGWYMDSFLEPPEVRILADSLVLSRISTDALADLVAKLQDLAGEASLGIEYLANAKTSDTFNGEFLFTIEHINEAIRNDRAITFGYSDYNSAGKLVPHISRRTGTAHTYHADPYQMVFKNGRYYLVCHLHNEDQLRIFVIDRITDLTITDKAREQPNPSLIDADPATNQPGDFDPVQYMRERPYPVTNPAERIVLAAKASAFNAIFEWFDEPTIGKPNAAGWHKVIVRSPILAAKWWALQYVDLDVRVLEPAKLRDQLAQAGMKLAMAYGTRGDKHHDGDGRA